MLSWGHWCFRDEVVRCQEGKLGPPTLLPIKPKPAWNWLKGKVYDVPLFCCPWHPMILSLDNDSGLTMLFLCWEWFFSMRHLKMSTDIFDRHDSGTKSSCSCHLSSRGQGSYQMSYRTQSMPTARVIWSQMSTELRKRTQCKRNSYAHPGLHFAEWISEHWFI